MCGICGMVTNRLESEELERTVHHMTRALVHRGPDGRDARVFMPPTSPRPVALGHTRLAIIDLSDAGKQPMCNEDGTVWIVYNGEVYNFPELREELEAKGHQFSSRTDTEVIVHLYEELGPECVQRLNGMYAFAILDLRNRNLFLARDPIGVKPLYYCALPECFLFGSEIKSILVSERYKVDVNWQAVYDYFTFLYVPCPETIFDGIRQVPPGHYLNFNLEDGSYQIERYWQPRRLEAVENAPLDDLKVQLRQLLTESVGRQLVSDVPLGVFLSGGVDSTIITGLARQTGAPVSTFTVVFQGKDFEDYNEQETARAVARHLGTEHHELDVPTSDLMDVLNLVELFDQPFGNPTFYLMYLISKYAREYITVALCGAGGDELYAGYPRYRAVQLARQLRPVPRSLLRLGNKALGYIHDPHHSPKLRRIRQFLEGLDDDSIRQFAKWTYFFDADKKEKLISDSRANGLDPSERSLRTAIENSPLSEPDNRLLHLDVQTFLVDNLLEYTDKTSMAVGLEVRVPLLDPQAVEYGLNVPFDYKLRNGKSKILLRETFADFFPPEALKAPKRGFSVPLPQWMLRTFDAYFEASQDAVHPLKDILGSDIGETWQQGILNWSYIQELRMEHKQGRRDNSYELFAVIIFDIWWRKYITGSLPTVHWNPA